MVIAKTRVKNFHPSVITSHQGVAGTSITGGRFLEEYLGTLRFPQYASQTYDKMRRSDYQVQRMFRVINTPLLGADWSYIPVDLDDPEQQKQALYKNRFFKEHPTMPWTQLLSEILTFLPYGFALFEPYGQIVNDLDLGKVATLRSIGFLKQSTIYQWDVSENTLHRVRQVATENGQLVDTWIPGENLIHFANQMEGDNFEGVSLLRPVYGNFVRKDLYLKIDMIGLEKMSVGTPIFFVPKAILNNAEELDNLAEIGESYAAHEKSYMILDDRLKGDGFRLERGQYNANEVAAAISREDAGMLDSVLASFLTIGTMRAGGNAQNEGQMMLFLQSLKYIADYVSHKLDEYVHPWYVYNFGEPAIRLRMQVNGIMQDDAKRTMEVLTGYSKGGIIESDDVLERKIREDLDLPMKDHTTVRKQSATGVQQQTDGTVSTTMEGAQNEPK